MVLCNTKDFRISLICQCKLIRLQEVQILEANNQEGLALEDFPVMHSLVPFSLIKKLLLLFFIYKPAKGKSYKAYRQPKKQNKREGKNTLAPHFEASYSKKSYK